MTVKKSGTSWGYYFGHKGKRYRKQGFTTKRDALKAETEAKDRLNRGGVIDDRTDFLSYYANWHKLNKENVISEIAYNTYKNAGNQFESYLESENMSNLKLSELNQSIYRGFLKWYGQTHTSESVRKMHYCLKQAIHDAIQDGLLHRDATHNAKPIGMVEEKAEDDKFMTLHDFKALINYVSVKPVQSHLFIYMLAVTGSRFSGIRKMRYEHIDDVNNRLYLDDTKNDTSQRWVSVNAKDIEHIQSVLGQMKKNANGYIFHTGKNLITHAAVDKVFQRFLIKQKAGHFTLHALRHTHCSLLLHEGVSIYYISKRLGHKDISTTMRTYSHLLKETKDREEIKALEVLNNL
ncbi:tyrosine-type recombinase/integrase [Mammaliicoccus sciuri]|uniref:tyrosine-type recombinase/integrase n=1 Tax=Mammaliicoccus sciuri TaxID=1296 RepID=UPI003A8CE726